VRRRNGGYNRSDNQYITMIRNDTEVDMSYVVLFNPQCDKQGVLAYVKIMIYFICRPSSTFRRNFKTETKTYTIHVNSNSLHISYTYHTATGVRLQPLLDTRRKHYLLGIYLAWVPVNPSILPELRLHLHHLTDGLTSTAARWISSRQCVDVSIRQILVQFISSNFRFMLSREPVF
jgi:hypothetical protein